MKFIIDIDDITYEAIMNRDWFPFNAVSEAIHDGTPIPENATNGDVIKALFSDIEKIGGMIDETEYSNEHMSIVVDNAWWNKPYKKGDTE